MQDFLYRLGRCRKIDHARRRRDQKRVTLELGGKPPNVLLDDADPKKAIPNAFVIGNPSTRSTPTRTKRIRSRPPMIQSTASMPT